MGADTQAQTNAGVTALLCAQDAMSVQALLEGHAKIDFETSCGTTALIEAARDGRVRELRLDVTAC